MSNIYDALRKSRGEEPPPPPPPPPPEATGGFSPRAQLDRELIARPHAEFMQELDALRGNLEVLLGSTARRIVAFMGSVAGEGATTLTAHFGYLMARVASKQTLVIDADMGRSGVGLSDALGDRPGLAELLARDLPLEDVILGTADPHLHFLPAGEDRVHHVEAIGAGRLRPVLERLSKHYEAIVVDNSPILRHAEAPLIGASCDGVVLVIRANHTRRELAQRALAELNFARCRILGSVLNARKGTLPGFLRERV